MTNEQYAKLFRDTDFVHTSGTPAETKVAEYLRDMCISSGVPARLESFSVPMGTVKKSVLTADGMHIPCKGFACCGSGSVTAPLYYMPGNDPVSIAGAKDSIVLIDAGGFDLFTYKDLLKVGAKGIICRYGNLYYEGENYDIDERDLRAAVRDGGKKLLCVMIHARDAVRLVRDGVNEVTIDIEQDEYEGVSHNVVAELPGKNDEYIVMTAHYDTTSMSHGANDNMSGCAALLGAMDTLKETKHNYGIRFVFCGSEERGLLGSKAYVNDHSEELDRIALNVNIDMIGTIMGKFIACASAEEGLKHYIRYMGAEVGFPVAARSGVYSSDSTPFADKGVPAVSFARLAGSDVAPIHCRYDTADVMSMDRLAADIGFITEFTRRMADAVVCPVSRDIPEDIVKELDEYLFRKRKAH